MSHPILDAAAAMDAALKTVADVNPVFMVTHDKATALVELSHIEARVTELRLRVMATATDVAEGSGARDVASWLAHKTLTRGEDARSDQRLAQALDARWVVLAAAVRDAEVNLEQARVIAACLDDLLELPAEAEVAPEILTEAEKVLVQRAATLDPKQLRRIGRRILEIVAPQIAEEAEARRLAALEAAAHRRTRLTLRRQGDGTSRLSGRLPDAAATRLATYLEAFTNPRKQAPTQGTEADRECSADEGCNAADPVSRLPYPRRLGEAFVQLLEMLDPGRLPIHGGDATTIIITIPFAALTSELAAAEHLDGAGRIPGDDPTGGGITASQARRLACNARLVPAVLGSDSEVLDLGRSTRLFSAAQRRALLLRDSSCRATGCDIPGTWSEAHHWLP